MQLAQQLIETCREFIKDRELIKVCGRVNKVVGLVIEGTHPRANIGDICQIQLRDAMHNNIIEAEVIGFRAGTVLLMPLADTMGIGAGARIVSRGRQKYVKVGRSLLGRVINGLGLPLDDKGPIRGVLYPIYNEPINPLHRQRIKEPIVLGIRAIDVMLTCGKGQRLAIMAGSGVGKSVLLGMIARNTKADINVIALIGERGREVREFIEKDLGEEGLRRSVLVVATSDTSPLMRIRAAFVATAIAEYFRGQGKNVLFMMDSITRFAMAQREIGLAAGEPPTTKGYPPSVFNLLPKLLERVGTSNTEGSITGLYTVLVEGDDMNEPIADAVRSILDGHIVLSRELANHNHYPAIDVLSSISRLMKDITEPKHVEYVARVIDIMSTYKRYEDVINIGAYKEGTNPRLDYSIRMMDKLRPFLRQGITEKADFSQSLNQLYELFNQK
ncbi:MAG: flagellar protein export ATPase FliI [Thermodesulfovibrionales bacterium]|nr:flagellar protein export ATPase FliI [Thermodesulfovibrionales bacterium]